MIDLKNICESAQKVVREAADFIETNRGVRSDQIEKKEFNSLVTFVDKTAEEILVTGLSEILPEAGFITEEETENTTKGKEWLWIIDPLDGTTNFLYQLPFYSVSVALFDKNLRGHIGIVYDIKHDMMFTAWKNGGAYKNGNPIHVSTRHLRDSLLATGFPFTDFKHEEAYYQLLRTVAKECTGLRRCGSAALDLAYVADGVFDGFFEYSLQLYDIAGGAVLVQEAGGKIADITGEDKWHTAWSIWASNGVNYEEFLKISHRNGR